MTRWLLPLVLFAQACGAPGRWVDTPHGVRSVSLSHDGARVRCAPDWALEQKVNAFDALTGEPGTPLDAPLPDMHTVAFVAEDPRGELLAVASDQGHVLLLDPVTWKVQEARLGAAVAERQAPGAGTLKPDVQVEDLAWAPGGELVAVSVTRRAPAGKLGAVVLLGRDGALVRELPAENDRGPSVAFAPDGQSLWLFGDDAVLRRLAAPSGEPVQPAAAFEGARLRATDRGLAASQDGAAVYAACDAVGGNTLARYPAPGGPPAWRVTLPGRCVGLGVSEATRVVALCDRLDGNVVESQLVVLAADDGRELARLELEGSPRALDVLRRGDRLVVGVGPRVGVLSVRDLVD